MFGSTRRKIVMVIAPKQFRDEELFLTKQRLGELGWNVRVASRDIKTATGKLGGKVKPDLAIEDIRVDEFDAIVMVGGPGASTYVNSPPVHRLLKLFQDKGKVVAAICLAPLILAKAGVLQGKNATADVHEREKLAALGINLLDRDVVVDDGVVTADGPRAAASFAEAIHQTLQVGDQGV